MASHTFFAVVLLSPSAVLGWMLTSSVEESFQRGEYYDQPMKNIEDVSYSAAVKIGGQTMDAILDSGSFDLEVVSKRCGSTCNGRGRHKYFDRRKSHTYAAGDLIQLTVYESGGVYAQSGTEKVELGPLVVPGQVFWEVVYAELPILSYGDFQVVLGVSPPGIDQDEVDAVAELAPNMSQKFREEGFEVPANFSEQRYKEELPQQKTLLENLGTHSFSICLEPESGAPGHFIWNDASATDKASLFRAVPTQGKIMWSAHLTGVTLGGNKKPYKACNRGGCSAVIDSGTSLVLVPSKVYDDVYDHLDALNADCDRLHELPNLAFDLGGLSFELPPSAYLGLVDNEWASLDKSEENSTNSHELGFSSKRAFRRSSVSDKHSDDKICSLLLDRIDVKTQYGEMWILGMPFFRTYYVNFQLGENLHSPDSRTMNIATASHKCSPIEPSAELDALSPHTTPRYINPRKLQIPRWARKAHKRGRMVI